MFFSFIFLLDMVLMTARVRMLQFKRGAMWTYKRWQWKIVSHAVMDQLFQKIQLVLCLAVGRQQIPLLF